MTIYEKITGIRTNSDITKVITDMIKKGVDPSEITALFRSKETAEEIKRRVEAELERNVPDLMVTTFIALNEGIIAQEWQALGLPENQSGPASLKERMPWQRH